MKRKKESYRPFIDVYRQYLFLREHSLYSIKEENMNRGKFNKKFNSQNLFKLPRAQIIFQRRFSFDFQCEK